MSKIQAINLDPGNNILSKLKYTIHKISQFKYKKIQENELVNPSKPFQEKPDINQQYDKLKTKMKFISRKEISRILTLYKRNNGFPGKSLQEVMLEVFGHSAHIKQYRNNLPALSKSRDG